MGRMDHVDGVFVFRRQGEELPGNLEQTIHLALRRPMTPQLEKPHFARGGQQVGQEGAALLAAGGEPAEIQHRNNSAHEPPGE